MRRTVTVSVAYYSLLLIATAAIQLQLLPRLLPDPIATRVGHNSEGYVLALVIAAWIQFVRPRLHLSDRRLLTVIAVSTLCFAVAMLLFLSDYPSRIKTLNETFFALAVLIPYVQLQRMPSRRTAVLHSALVLLVIVIAGSTALVTDLAETLGALLLTPIGLYVVDRGILDETAKTWPPWRYAWYAMLLTLPFVMSGLQYDIGLSGILNDTTRYIVRFHEAFVFILLVELFFAVGLGRTGRRDSPGAPRGQLSDATSTTAAALPS